MKNHSLKLFLAIFAILMFGSALAANNSENLSQIILFKLKCNNQIIYPKITQPDIQSGKAGIIQIAGQSPLKSCVATFETTNGKVTVNGLEQISGTTPNDIQNNMNYVVNGKNNYFIKLISPESSIVERANKKDACAMYLVCYFKLNNKDCSQFLHAISKVQENEKVCMQQMNKCASDDQECQNKANECIISNGKTSTNILTQLNQCEADFKAELDSCQIKNDRCQMDKDLKKQMGL